MDHLPDHIPQHSVFLLVLLFIDRLEFRKVVLDRFIKWRSLGLSWLVERFDHQPEAEDREPKRPYQMGFFEKTKARFPSQTNESI